MTTTAWISVLKTHSGPTVPLEVYKAEFGSAGGLSLGLSGRMALCLRGHLVCDSTFLHTLEMLTLNHCCRVRKKYEKRWQLNAIPRGSTV